MKISYTAASFLPALLAFTMVFSPLHLDGQSPDEHQISGKLKIAACQFPVSRAISENASWIETQMREAAAGGAQIVQFPECALSGYPGVDMETLEGYPWDSLRNHTESIMDLARELHVWVLLGSMHPLGEGFRPMNSVYLISDEGTVRDRYDKRFCTRGDLMYFSAGDHFVTFDLEGVTCGILICFDVRFPELYREYCKLGADVIFQSFYNARQKPGGIHPKIMPVTAQGHAGINHVYLSLTNSSAPSSWPCHFITPDGLVAGKLETDRPGILFSEIDLSENFYDASKGLRDRALQGKLSSEDPPEHQRYSDRTSL
ncbi:MAG: carbon-nitrogen hydrolase family protein [Bacteroidales bacterium]